MFKTVEELKSFIQWAQDKQIKRVKIGDIEVEVSDIFYANKIMNPTSSQPAEFEDSKNTNNPNELSEDEYEDLLFHSAGN